jgi:F0F1-type ATP synthase delta subunit
MEIFEDFAKKVITKEDLIFFLDQINLAEQFLFKERNIPLTEKLRGKVSEDFKGFIEKLERENVITRDVEKNRIFFENLKNYLLKIPQIKIEIAFKPSRIFVEKISLWLEKNFGEKIIVDLYFNPEIVGGAIVEYKGKYLNYSLEKKIDELISKKLS